MTTNTNPSNLFIDIMNLNSKCLQQTEDPVNEEPLQVLDLREGLFDATSAFIYRTSILENELIRALEHGAVKKDNIAQISRILMAIEDMNHYMSANM